MATESYAPLGFAVAGHRVCEDTMVLQETAISVGAQIRRARSRSRVFSLMLSA
jgi:hypothetical protein